ncbi:type II secretion system protein GspM [Pseudoduganella sp. LjRoot289]|uniref:type II secretion system protein GspM n=1 Tax=Pseudoduganella sp. LjRoot289 TaxID=3342314 RepID=UPI003ED06C25
MMKQEWKKLEARVEALSLRERGMVAFAAAAAVVFVVYSLLMEPAFKREKTLQMQMLQQRSDIVLMDGELVQRQAIAQMDPDLSTRQRLEKIQHENETMRESLRTMQKGLVPPERIGQLLEQMLQGNSRLKLVSLKTLPARGMSDGRFAEPDPAESGRPQGEVQRMMTSSLSPVPPPAAAPSVTAPGAPAAPVTPSAPRAPVKQEELLYRHGVQVVLQGNYLDMVSYMESLERMPAQLFWGKATLDSADYPKVRLTLTLYTLSLDTKWISL